MRLKVLVKSLPETCRRLFSHWFFAPVCRVWYKFKYKHVASPDKIVEVNINDIQAWYRGNRYSEFTFPGIIKNGDWSGKITPRNEILSESEKYKGIVQRFKYNLAWKDTDLFRKKFKKRIKSGASVNGYDNLNDLENYYKKRYGELYSSIKEEGVKAPTNDHPDIDPIYININKDGEILYTTDGNHRLYMCMVTGIQKIPVKVWLRHSRWQEKRDYILRKNGRNLDNRFKKYLTHPDIISELGHPNCKKDC